MSFNITVRVLGMALFGAAGFFLGIYLSPMIYGTDTGSYNELATYLTLFGAIFGLIITPYITIYPFRWLRTRLRLMPPLDLLSLTVGLFVALLLSALLSWPLSLLPGWLGQVAPTILTLLLVYLGVYVAVARKR